MGRAVMEAIDHLSEVVVGSDPWETERLWQLMFRGNFFPADRTYGCAISAIDIALWDIKGKSVGMPVYKLMGGPTRDKVVCYAHTQGDNHPSPRRQLQARARGRRVEIRPMAPTRNLRQRPDRRIRDSSNRSNRSA